MSISNPTNQLTNPAEVFLEWESKKSYFKWYDKKLEKEHIIQLPFAAVLLDQLATVTGFNDSLQCRIYSNEVRSTKADRMRIKSFKQPGINEEGLYRDIIHKATGAKFAASLYLLAKIDGKPVIANLKLSGAACNAWIDFYNKNKRELTSNGFVFMGTSKEKKGGNEYNKPLIELVEVQPATLAKAIELDSTILQPYLAAYLDYQGTSRAKEIAPAEDHNPFTEDPPVDPPHVDDYPNPVGDGVDDLPF